MATDNFLSDYIFEDSDQELGTDSEDEIQTMLGGTPKQRRHIRRRSIGIPSDSSEDEFEKEMNAELSHTMVEDYSYNDETAKKTKLTKEQEEENDKLLYDPQMDDEDQKWVDKQRRKYQTKAKEDTSSSNSKPLPQSDAVLNCPACMCALCLDCQRHELYENQYRAMFVMNCLVNYGETLKFSSKAESFKSKKNRKRKHAANKQRSSELSQQGSEFNDLVTVDSSADNHTGEDYYHPVMCSNCNTRVAVFDDDEVYHFFNVLSSHS